MTELDLLKKDRAEVGGVIFREVRLGKASTKPPCYGKERSIDGVHIQTPSSEPRALKEINKNSRSCYPQPAQWKLSR